MPIAPNQLPDDIDALKSLVADQAKKLDHFTVRNEQLQSKVILLQEQLNIALAKRYAQDNPLDWGVAADRKAEDLTRHAPEGATLRAARKERSDAANRRDDRDDDERNG